MSKKTKDIKYSELNTHKKYTSKISFKIPNLVFVNNSKTNFYKNVNNKNKQNKTIIKSESNKILRKQNSELDNDKLTIKTCVLRTKDSTINDVKKYDANKYKFNFELLDKTKIKDDININVILI